MHYELDANHKYHLFNNGTEIRLGETSPSTIAIVYDINKSADQKNPSWILLKHGAPATVKKWFDVARSQFFKQGNLGKEIANDIIFLEGAFPPNEINHAIETSGYVKTLVTNFLNTIEVQSMEITNSTSQFNLACEALQTASAQFKAGEIKSYPYSRIREEHLTKALDALATELGVNLEKPLMINSLGEYSIVAMHPDGRSPQMGCGKFTQEFVDLLNPHSPRTGTQPSFMTANNGWCKVFHFGAEAMVLKEYERRLLMSQAQSALDVVAKSKTSSSMAP